jgi:hypothetical protein
VTPTQFANGAGVITVDSAIVNSGASSSLITLTYSTVITVIVTSADKTKSATYTVTVTRALPDHIDTLSALVTSASLTPGFSSSVFTYTLTLPPTTSTFTYTATATDPLSSVTYSVASPLTLDIGTTKLSIAVTAQDGVNKSTYSISVLRTPGLSSLVIPGATLSPTFNASLLNYALSFPYTTTSITVTPTALANTDATIMVATSNVASGVTSPAITLVTGTNNITIKVTSKDSTASVVYTVVVTREKDVVSTLSALTTSPVALSPAFSSATTNYAISVTTSTPTVTVTTTTTSAVATVNINPTSPSPVPYGKSNIIVTVTAQNGVNQTSYTISVTRPASLAGLISSGGSLIPSFVPATASYSLMSRVPLLQ